jgi:hypothetical protein
MPYCLDKGNMSCISSTVIHGSCVSIFNKHLQRSSCGQLLVVKTRVVASLPVAMRQGHEEQGNLPALP